MEIPDILARLFGPDMNLRNIPLPPVISEARDVIGASVRALDRHYNPEEQNREREDMEQGLLSTPAMNRPVPERPDIDTYPEGIKLARSIFDQDRDNYRYSRMIPVKEDLRTGEKSWGVSDFMASLGRDAADTVAGTKTGGPYTPKGDLNPLAPFSVLGWGGGLRAGLTLPKGLRINTDAVRRQQPANNVLQLNANKSRVPAVVAAMAPDAAGAVPPNLGSLSPTSGVLTVPTEQINSTRKGVITGNYERGDDLVYESVARAPGKSLDKATLKGAPPHVTNRKQANVVVEDHVALALQGFMGKHWYDTSGRALSNAASGQAAQADRLMRSIGQTSNQTQIHPNVAYGIRAQHAAMVGDNIVNIGKFPGDMTPALEKIYAPDEITRLKRKTGPYHQNTVQPFWDFGRPNLLTNDVMNMRGIGWGIKWEGTPTASQDRFAQWVNAHALPKIEEATGQRWTTEEVQAAVWGEIRRLSAIDTGKKEPGYQDMATGLGQQIHGGFNMETAPGPSTGFLESFMRAPYETRQAYHEAMLNDVYRDSNGYDLINKHFGVLSGPSVNVTGVFKESVNPGTQHRPFIPKGHGPSGQEIDPSSWRLAEAAEITRAIVGMQDAAAGYRPFVTARKNANQIQIDIGRPLTQHETIKLYAALRTGFGIDDILPVGEPDGAALLNFGFLEIDNKDFHRIAKEAIGKALSGNVTLSYGGHKSFYLENNWKNNPNGEDYRKGLDTLGPDLLTRADQITSVLRERKAAVDAKFAQHFGWGNDLPPAGSAPSAGQVQNVSEVASPRPWLGAIDPHTGLVGPRRSGIVGPMLE
jgi:hypothetical protein